jgi:predicted house-cleaning noncanonical NTP pyrophosphatase (MazG superfamily)
MTAYLKLIRDKVPEIIKKTGKICHTIKLSDKGFKDALIEKLKEEVKEFEKEKNIEKLADIIEVIYSITDSFDFDSKEVYNVREQKRLKNGGFKNKVFLISVDD